jgi:peptide/nickel transport system substrate-binding protein/oligopeptide transport system substrate-binding protein
MKRYKLLFFFLILIPFEGLFFLNPIFQKSLAEIKEKEGPIQGGEYRRPLEFMPRTLDPALAADIYSVTVIQQLFDGLVQFDQNLNIIPAISKSWQISRDGLTYTFNLREGIKFHNGREVIAEDFVYSFSRIINPKTGSPAAHLFEKVLGAKEFQEGKVNYVEGFRSVGKYTFQIKLYEPFYPFISVLGIINFKVVPREEIEKSTTNFPLSPIGTGPFKLVSMKERKEIIIEANPGYFEGRPYLNKILIKIFDGAPREKILQEFKQGGLEESFLPPEEIEEMAKGKDYLFLQKPILSLRFYGFNSNLEPLNNKNLRKAVNFAIDKKYIVSSIHRNQFNLAKRILPPGMPGYDPTKETYPFDENRARKYLNEADYGKGKTIPPLEIWSASKSEAAQKELNEIQSQLKKVGITTKINFETNWPSFESMLRTNKAPIFIYVWYADFPDPDNYLGTLFHSKSRSNFTNYHNLEIDRLLDLTRTERDYLKRMEMYRKIEEKILDDAPIVPMVNNLFQMVYQPYVRGVEVSALGGPYIPMRKIWLKKE